MLVQSVYEIKCFISLFERAFKVMKDGVYFIVTVLLLAELFEILIYANGRACDVTRRTQNDAKSQKRNISEDFSV